MSDESPWSQRERFDLYVERVSELHRLRVVRENAIGYEFNFHWNRDNGTRLRLRQPDEEDLRSFLLSFRHVVSKKEPVHVNRIHNLLWEELDSDPIREGLNEAKARWKRACRAGVIALNINGVELPSDELLDMWINGIYFHNDKRMRATLEQAGPMVGFVSRFKFLDHLITGTHYITYLGNVILHARSDGRLTV